MKTTLIKIGNETFEECNKPIDNEIRYTDLWSCYDRPSSIKIAIWDDWKAWFRHNSSYCGCIGIGSANGFRFTVVGTINLDNGKTYDFRITPSHNYCYEIKNA